MSISALRKINSVLKNRGRYTESASSGILLAAFAFGVVFGSLVGVYSGAGDFELSGSQADSGGAWLFFLLLLFFSTSYLGVFLIPALMFVRGCIFSCSVAVLCYAMGYRGLLLALLSSALPLCFLLPCYIVVGEDCFRLSRSLAELRLGRGGCGSAHFPLRHFVILLLLIFLDSMYSAYVLPELASALI